MRVSMAFGSPVSGGRITAINGAARRMFGWPGKAAEAAIVQTRLELMRRRCGPLALVAEHSSDDVIIAENEGWTLRGNTTLERMTRYEAGDQKKPPGEGNLKMYDVLVAEDHPVNQLLIREILTSIGCRVTMADTGQRALEEIRAGDFDLVIMDNLMPVMTGLEAIGCIRARSDWKARIPIIALTASSLPEDETAYKAHGIEAFMTKPLDMNDVIETVKRLGKEGRRIRDAAHSTME